MVGGSRRNIAEELLNLLDTVEIENIFSVINASISMFSKHHSSYLLCSYIGLGILGPAFLWLVLAEFAGDWGYVDAHALKGLLELDHLGYYQVGG